MMVSFGAKLLKVLKIRLPDAQNCTTLEHMLSNLWHTILERNLYLVFKSMNSVAYVFWI